MKYRYYVVDYISNNVFGTNNLETAKEYAECEDNVVIDSYTGFEISINNGYYYESEIAECP